MKFTVSFASVALVVLALPLLWVKPGGALLNGAWPPVAPFDVSRFDASRFDAARLGFAPGDGADAMRPYADRHGGADFGIARRDVARPSGAQSPIKTIYPTFTTIDVPGAGVTGVYGINSAGDMVGYYGADSNAPHKHGFLLKGGVLTRVDYPHAYFTSAYAIDDAGLVVGSAELQGGYISVGFTYDGATFKRFRDGDDAVTIPYGISNGGDIVGGAGTLDTTKGFEERDGLYRTINFPGLNIYADAAGINNLGEIVGFTDYDAYSYVRGQFQNLDVPGALQTEARGINDNGVVVGWYDVYAGCVCAFAELHGQYFSFSYPGAAFTGAAAVSNLSQVVGQYTFDYKTWHGFTASLNLGPGL